MTVTEPNYTKGPWEQLLGRQSGISRYADLSSVDAFGPNPLAAMLEIQHPDRFGPVSAVLPPPRMFAGGNSDLPSYCASGVDPELLVRLPYGVRHAVAREPDTTRVHEAFEAYVGQADAMIPTDALVDAALRLDRWLQTDTRTPEQIAQDDAEHEQMMLQLGYSKRDSGRYGPRRMGRG